MPTTLDEIMRAALTLAPDSRTILVERLMRSLEAQTDSGDDPIVSLPPRVPGTALGMITIGPGFDDDLPDDILDAFEA
jgi:hypothetical protein